MPFSVFRSEEHDMPAKPINAPTDSKPSPSTLRGSESTAAVGGTRTPSGSNYGDYAPAPAPPGMDNPSRGAEMEGDLDSARGGIASAPEAAPVLDMDSLDATSAEHVSAVERPATGNDAGGDTGGDRASSDGIGHVEEPELTEEHELRARRIREAAYERYQRRGDSAAGDPVDDWLAAEAEFDQARRPT
jgi:hypothetical protein